MVAVVRERPQTVLTVGLEVGTGEERSGNKAGFLSFLLAVVVEILGVMADGIGVRSIVVLMINDTVTISGRRRIRAIHGRAGIRTPTIRWW